MGEGMLWLLPCILLFLRPPLLSAKEVVLLDTRQMTSELRWKTDSKTEDGAGWLEETVTNYENLKTGRNSRAYVVCQVDEENVDNWLRTPYVDVRDANRVSIEVTFTMRDCSRFPRRAITCGETFTLLYHESARELKDEESPPWKETPLATVGFKQIDRITGDTGRFSGGEAGDTSPENVETKSIPVSKGGVYFAFRDQGACTSILAVRVFYEVCPELVVGLARFPETAVGATPSDVIPMIGRCVEGSGLKVGGEKPQSLCKGDGGWAATATRNDGCTCKEGYAPAGLATCLPCPSGQYSLGDQCASCPANTDHDAEGASICPCELNMYRAAGEGPEVACTAPPQRPLELRILRSGPNSAVIAWSPPANLGGRRELWYKAVCKECPPGVQMSPGGRRLTTTQLRLTGLRPGKRITVFIYAENDVSVNATVQPSYDVIEIETPSTSGARVGSVEVLSAAAESLALSWDPPTRPVNNIAAPAPKQYQVEYAAAHDKDTPPNRVVTEEPMVTLRELRAGMEYRLRVRALEAEGEWSEWSDFVYATTGSAAAAGKDKKGTEPSTMVLIAVGCIIVLCFLIFAIVYASRHRNGPSDRRKQPSDLDVLDYRAGGHLTPDYPHSGLHFGPASDHHTLGKKMTAPLMPGTLRPGAFKPYIDPFDYEDPNAALREFTHELDPQYLYIEQIILGGGEFGEVHQGKLKLPGRPEEKVAIKSLLPNASQKARDDFLQEAAVMGQFDHPNVVRLKGVISRSDPVMIITEFMLNKSLDHFLRQNDGRLTLAQQMAMLRGISAGMKYLSDKGYVHRDLAARNVLVDECCECKISDFGLSRGMSGLTSSEQVYHTKGGKIPVRWTAPEAITHRKYTSASDVWSMGIVMWEVASYGERPYWDWSNQEVIKSVESGYRLPPPLNCPAGLHALMLECWKRERAERPSFAVLLRRLDEFARIPELAYATSSVGNSTHSSDLYDQTIPPVSGPPPSYHHHTGSTLSTPLANSPSPSQPPPPAPMQPPPLPSLKELLSSLGLAHFASPMAANGVDSVLALKRLGMVDLMTYGLGQADCQRITDAVHHLTAHIPANATLSRPRHPPLPSVVASLGRPGTDQGYFI